MRRYLPGFLINHEKTVCICVRETGTDRDGLFSFVLLTAPVRWNGKKRCCYPMSFPFSIRRTLSCHLSRVERWPMLMTVVPGSAVRRRYIFSSVSSSMALVASSRKTHFGFLRNTRTKASFCCSPKERMWLQSASVSGFSIKWERPHSIRRGERISLSAVSSGYDEASAEVPMGM